MNADQVPETRRKLRQMNDAANQAIDRHVTGSMDQLTQTQARFARDERRSRLSDR